MDISVPPIIITSRLGNLEVKMYMKGAEVAYKILGKQKHNEIYSGGNPKSYKCKARFGAKN